MAKQEQTTEFLREIAAELRATSESTTLEHATEYLEAKLWGMHPPEPKPPAQDKVRVLRIIEYVGDRDRVEATVAKSIHGTRVVTDGKNGRLEIRAATIGTYPDILTGLEPDSKPTPKPVSAPLPPTGQTYFQMVNKIVNSLAKTYNLDRHWMAEARPALAAAMCKGTTFGPEAGLSWNSRLARNTCDARPAARHLYESLPDWLRLQTSGTFSRAVVTAFIEKCIEETY